LATGPRDVTTTRTTCAYCGVGCGILATVENDGSVSIKGDPDHPANYGKLCSKGLALGETLSDPESLSHPSIDGERVDWTTATRHVAHKFSEAIREHGPDSVAFYVSGQLLTEDYYVANKLMKGFIGSANIDTNSRLCMASAVAGHKRAFGADVVPCSYTDLDKADLIVLVGSNLAWCHPVLFQRIQAEREKRALKLIVIDPRRTVTAEEADLHLPILPGSDVALFNGLLKHLYSRGDIDARFIFARTSGLAEALVAANEWTVSRVAEACGIDQALIGLFYDLFASHARTVTAFSMGVNQSCVGTDKVNAIINCHLLTGRIGKEGAGPFSITGQPNAMGGREVGGMANMLAAHMEIENAGHRAAVQEFWHSPTIAVKPGLKAVDMFKAVKDGTIKALWIMATNPAVSLPDAIEVAAALKACPFVVVSDVTAGTQTAQHADVLLPAAGWGEKDGTVTNSERRISRQRGFLPLHGEAKPDWKIICDVAKAMGFDGFEYETPDEIFREHAALTQIENAGTRKLDLGGLAKLLPGEYDTLAPYQWGGENPFINGRFQTETGKAQFVATPVELPQPARCDTFVLNTGRIRDQWHTMTRTGLAPRLMRHRAEPYLEICASDAARLGLRDASLATVTSGSGSSILRVLISDSMRQGEVFQPMHWSAPFSSRGLANSAVTARLDPISGQPDLKSAVVSVTPFKAAWFGFGLSLTSTAMTTSYWSKQKLGEGIAFECANECEPRNWREFMEESFGLRHEADEITVVEGSSPSQFRWALFRAGVLHAAFFASGSPVSVSRSWLTDRLGEAGATPLDILAGRPRRQSDDAGAVVCACMNVGRNPIVSFMAQHPGASVDAVCRATGAGTGCGSCRPEIAKVIHEAQSFRQAAE
jgi:assimilatory nitrate reductase catalytic subunit